ncbi:hypothetical protein NL676_002261 [Syzygium grande]|nr:hypothetical protein NL676_002261 [Syzygium grande]
MGRAPCPSRGGDALSKSRWGDETLRPLIRSNLQTHGGGGVPLNDSVGTFSDDRSPPLRLMHTWMAGIGRGDSCGSPPPWVPPGAKKKRRIRKLNSSTALHLLVFVLCFIGLLSDDSGKRFPSRVSVLFGVI